MFEEGSRQPISLVELCVKKAIDNVRYIGYVGGVEFKFLERILQHCKLEQLKHVEDCTNDTDLSPVTEKYWKRFCEKNFGEDNLNSVVEKMKQKKVSFKWRELYEAKEKEVVEKLRKSYNKEDVRKQSRQVKVCTKAPPFKKPFWGNSVSGCYNPSKFRSDNMKKAKLDHLKSSEVKNFTSIKRNTIEKSFSPSTSRNLPPKSINSFLGTTPRSIACGERNLPPKSINGLLGTASSTARSFSCGARELPPKRFNSFPVNATSTSRNAATKRKYGM